MMNPEEIRSQQSEFHDAVNSGSTFYQGWQTHNGPQINVEGGIRVIRIDPTNERNQRNHAALRQKVKSFWIDGVLRHSLYNEVLIRVNMASRSDLVNNRPWDLILRRPDLTDESIRPDQSICEIFDQMGQRLLVLGEPGSGKTTTLLKLTAALLVRSEQDLTYPTPVIFNLSSWAVKQKSLAAWLIDELNVKYNIPIGLAQSWQAQEEILPLLDGLDEVPEEHRGACVLAINHFLQNHLIPLVVCCRLREYENLPQRLKLDVALQIQPLMNKQIANYFNHIGIADSGITEFQIKQSELLEDWFRSPLMLSIIALTSAGAKPPHLPIQTLITSSRPLLFDAYIQRMFEHRGLSTHPYSATATLHWLQWLAKQMLVHNIIEFHLEDLQPDWLAFNQPLPLLLRPLAWFGFKMIILLILATIGVLWGMISGVTLGALGGLLIAVVMAFTLAQNTEFTVVQPVIKFSWRWDYARNGCSFGFLLALILTFLMSLFPVFEKWPIFSFGLGSGLMFGGFIRGGIVQQTDVDNTVSHPSQRIHWSGRAGLLTISLVILSGGLLLTPIFLFNPVSEIPYQSLLTLTGVLLITSLIWGLRYGGAAYVVHYLLRYLLFITGHLPYRYVHFLDYTTTCLFLHKVGGGYIFIHHTLLKHFAALTNEDIARITAGLRAK